MISKAAPGPTADAGRRVRLAAVAGMIGAVLFVSVFTIYGWLLPGYSPTRMFVSELSLGPCGWVQILNFLLTGALMLIFGVGLAAHFTTGAASRAGPALIQGIGVSLMASGPFTTDPSAMFGQTSAGGIVHGIFGALVCTASTGAGRPPVERFPRTRCPRSAWIGADAAADHLTHTAFQVG